MALGASGFFHGAYFLKLFKNCNCKLKIKELQNKDYIEFKFKLIVTIQYDNILNHGCQNAQHKKPPEQQAFSRPLASACCHFGQKYKRSAFSP